jgi:hypothetical protein
MKSNTDYVVIGSSPSEESCVQVITGESYLPEMRKECNRFIERIREVCGDEPEEARLKVKEFPHDFGPYLEVVCEFCVDNEWAEEYAYFVEENAPITWFDQ